MTAKKLTRTEALMDVIRVKIANRVLNPSDRLPSVRRFAAIMNVSPSTVVDAYDRLVAEGIIRARRGSGFYVTGSDMPPMALAEMGAIRDRDIDPFWVSKQSLETDESVLKPGCGWLPPDWMPHDALRKAMRSISRSDNSLLTDYGNIESTLALRHLLLRRFTEEGLDVGVEQILLTNSGTQAIDLICRLILRPGDTVLIDDPCYFNFQALLRAHQVKVKGVPLTPKGPDINIFENILKEQTPRLYITNSALHNPTGASLSPQTAYRVLTAASAHGMTIVEDDIFTDFEPNLSPRLAILDGLNRVIRIGSFSKTLSASMRCGYIAANPEWIEGLTDLQIATSFGGPSPITTAMIVKVLSGGTYRKHMDEVRHRLTLARLDVAKRLSAIGIQPWLMPRGGFYLWCQLPYGMDSALIARHCMDEKIMLAPGNAFSVSQSSKDFLRFNVAQTQDYRIFNILQRLVKKI